MEKVKLYRATNRKSDAKKIPSGSCWTPDYAVAVEYTRNPGFGGKHIVEIDIEPEYVLDLRFGRQHWETEPLRQAKELVAEIIGIEPSEICAGYIHEIIDDPTIREKLSKHYDWVIYYDSFPDGAETWVRL